MQAFRRISDSPDTLDSETIQHRCALNEKSIPHDISIRSVDGVHLAKRGHGDRKALKAKLVAIKGAGRQRLSR